MADDSYETGRTHDADDTLRCRRCLGERTSEELDRLIWCDDCYAAERRRARVWGRFVALAAATLLALWIALTIRPSRDFMLLWALVLIVAYFLGARLAGELAFGAIRVRNSAGARAGGGEASG